MNAVRVYECGDCGDLHEELREAEGCCSTTVYDRWKCDECGDNYALKLDADDCCREDDEEEEDE